MRRALLAALFFPLAIAAAQEKDDGFRWDPAHGRHVPVVGERTFVERVEESHDQMKVTLGGKLVKETAEAVVTSWLAVYEVVAVVGSSAVKERVKLERWERTVVGGHPDRSLTGHTVLLERLPKKCVVTVDDETDVSSQAHQWALRELGTERTRAGEEQFYPAQPVASGDDWPIDVKALADDGFPGVHYDAGASTARGRLTRVRVEEGVHKGHLEIDIKIKLDEIPGYGMPFVEGGFIELGTSEDRLLEPGRARQGKSHRTTRLAGVADKDSPRGRVHITKDAWSVTEETRGTLPALEKAAGPR